MTAFGLDDPIPLVGGGEHPGKEQQRLGVIVNHQDVAHPLDAPQRLEQGISGDGLDQIAQDT